MRRPSIIFVDDVSAIYILPLSVTVRRSKTVCKSNSSWLVRQTQHVQFCQRCSITSCIPLLLVKFVWDSDDGVLDCSVEVSFSHHFQLLQDHAGELFWEIRRKVILDTDPDHRLLILI